MHFITSHFFFFFHKNLRHLLLYLHIATDNMQNQMLKNRLHSFQVRVPAVKCGLKDAVSGQSEFTGNYAECWIMSIVLVGWKIWAGDEFDSAQCNFVHGNVSVWNLILEISLMIVSLKSSFLSSENEPFPGVMLAPQCEVKEKKNSRLVTVSRPVTLQPY